MNKTYLPDTILYGTLGLSTGYYRNYVNRTDKFKLFSFFNNHPVKSHRTLKQLKYIIDIEILNEPPYKT